MHSTAQHSTAQHNLSRSNKGLFAFSVLTLALNQAVYAADEPVAQQAQAISADQPTDAITLPKVRVTGTSVKNSYVAPVASTGTKTDTPIMETPVSVQVVPEAVIADQRVNRLQEALENVSGVRSNNTDLEGYVYKLRGFDSLNLFRNGLAVSYSIPTIEETANLERVEVVKGPASVLYGRIDPGGLINLVTKKPLTDPYYKLEQEIGSYNHKRTQWDATAALNETGSVAYRFSGAYQDYKSFRDFQGGHRLFLAPVVSFKPSADTDLIVDLQYMKNVAQSDTGFPALGGKPAPIPHSRSFQEANDPLDKTDSHHIGYEFTHRFNNNWSVTNRFLYSNATLWKLNVYPTALNEATGVMDRTTQYQWLAGRVYSTNLDVNGKFDALGAKHNIVLGLDYLDDYYDYNYAEGGGNFPINIYNPVYGSIPASAYQDAGNGVGFTGFSSVQVKQTGLYVQDQMTLFDKLHVLLGGRYDDAKVVSGWSGVSTAEAIADRAINPVKKDARFSPRAGILYDFTPQLSGYVSYSRSFGANNGFTTAGGAPLPPELGVQYETGLKAQLLDGLSANLAIFQLTKQNISQRVNPDVNPAIFRAIGEVRSRGVELDILGQMTERLGLIASYAYTDAKTTVDNSGLQGNRLDNVPTHSARLFATYDLGSGGLGWRVGGGGYAAGQVMGDRQNTFTLPGYARLDAFASYTEKYGGHLWSVQLNLNNLTNKKYFSGTDIFYNTFGNLGLLAAQPFTAMATFKLEY